MTIKEIQAKSILRKHKKIESWFLSRYGMNLYRGCTHDCVYCDGRAEKYQVEGEFGEEVAVKVNAIEVLARELNPKGQRAPLLKSGYIMVGGGVGDSYQPVEQQYQLTKQALETIAKYRFPIHILTKSTLVERDRELITQINRQSRAIVSMSFSSVDDAISTIVEPGVPSPTERLKTLAAFKQNGIACGMFLMPVIPMLTDTPPMLNAALRKAYEAGLDFVMFGGMTLKEGRQKIFFLKLLREHYPDLMEVYHHLYPGDKYGAAREEYYIALHQTFFQLAKRYKIPLRIPPALYRELVTETDLVVVILEHLDYLCKQQGRNSPYGYAAYSISQLKEPLPAMTGALRTIKGVGPVTERIIREILRTGTSSYYEQMLTGS